MSSNSAITQIIPYHFHMLFLFFELMVRCYTLKRKIQPRHGPVVASSAITCSLLSHLSSSCGSELGPLCSRTPAHCAYVFSQNTKSTNTRSERVVR